MVELLLMCRLRKCADTKHFLQLGQATDLGADSLSNWARMSSIDSASMTLFSSIWISLLSPSSSSRSSSSSTMTVNSLSSLSVSRSLSDSSPSPLFRMTIFWPFWSMIWMLLCWRWSCCSCSCNGYMSDVAVTLTKCISRYLLLLLLSDQGDLTVFS